jgi:hypothetical protein
MAIGAILEPLVVVSFLAFGTIVNRNKSSSSWSPLLAKRPEPWRHIKYSSDSEEEDVEASGRKEDGITLLPPTLSRTSSGSDTTLAEDILDKTTPPWRLRKLRFLGWEKEVTTPNTEVFRTRLLSRVLQRLPFLVEVWYWALIYWVCS